MAFSYQNYKTGSSVTKAQKALQDHEKSRVQDWNGGTYGKALQDTIDRINNREKFSYDMNADALYQQYKNQYMKLGNLAMTDTVGQASTLTGGYGNSYAVTAGQQAYNGYLDQLNSMIPQLYQLAMDKYQMEGSDMYNRLGMYGDAYSREYGQYRDQVADWNNRYDQLQNAYFTERDYDYGRYTDDYNRALARYQMNNSGGSGGGGGGSRSSSSSSTESSSDSSKTSTSYVPSGTPNPGVNALRNPTPATPTPPTMQQLQTALYNSGVNVRGSSTASSSTPTKTAAQKAAEDALEKLKNFRG